MNGYRVAANALTGARVVASLALVARPNVGLLSAAIASDWIDGSLARRGGAAGYGARFDLEADSLLTLCLAVAAVRSGAPASALLAPIARYAAVVARDPLVLSPREVLLDRVSGAPLMAVLGAWLMPRRLPMLRTLTASVAVTRCAALAALFGRYARGRGRARVRTR